MAATDAPPIMAVRRWLDGLTLPPDCPLIDVSQAAPVAPPPLALREAMAERLLSDESTHLYGPVLGLPALRAALAARVSRLYSGAAGPAVIGADQVAITPGCNMAFAAIMATLVQSGDEVLLPTPWYFNHKMWLDMNGIGAVPLPCGDGLVPDPAVAAGLITARTRAIVLVTPNNPTGVEYPASVVAAFRDLARARGLALVLDETYADFDSRSGPPHDLFADPDWPRDVIRLYSFSKAYRLTGHRVGAIVASAPRLAEVEKYLDTVAICPSQIGQQAALWGIEHLDQWLAGERHEILRRRQAMEQGFARLQPLGWRMLGNGAYFTYVAHPFANPAHTLAPNPAPDPARDPAKRLLHEAGVLCLPGTMFTPPNSPEGPGQLRLAFANIDCDGIATLIERIENLSI